MRRLLAVLLCLPLLATASSDLKDTAALTAACRGLPQQASQLRDNDQRQRFVICRDIAVLQHAGKVIYGDLKRLERLYNEHQYEALERIIRQELTYVLRELKTQSAVMQSLKLQAGEGVWVQPGRWAFDVDGNGQIEVWERHLLAIPKPGHQTPLLAAPSNDEAYYQAEHNLDARFQVDQSDVLWALAYHQFAQGVLELVLSYDIHWDAPFERILELKSPQGVVRAHQQVLAGLKTSDALRTSLLAETDDAAEWIPNPKQKQTVFPLPMDEQTFQTWKTLFDHVIPAWSGQTLLIATEKDDGLLAALAEFCPASQGIDIAAVFRKPVRYPFALEKQAAQQALSRQVCRAVDSKHPASQLFAFLTEYVTQQDKNPDVPSMAFLRHLYWVN